MKLYRRWDSVGKLSIAPAIDSEYVYRCGLFATGKDEHNDRQILNPVPVNTHSWMHSSSTRTLVYGGLLVGIVLEPGEYFIVDVSDLDDFYHTVIVNDSHARRNTIHGVFKGREFKGLNCYRADLDDVDVCAAFCSLAQGSCHAVELANTATAMCSAALVACMTTTP